MKVLLIDHEDSFVHNIEQALAEDGAEVRCLRATRPFAEAARFDPDAVVLSPGPGHPNDRRLTGLARELLEAWDRDRPFLGVCLGHQLIGQYYGGAVARGRRPVHGEATEIEHDGRGVFAGLPNPMRVARYHSLVVRSASVPTSLAISARDRQGVVMALRHRERPVDAVQFHPESYLTPEGPRLLHNFLEGARR